jgi:hypothetical protein
LHDASPVQAECDDRDFEVSAGERQAPAHPSRLGGFDHGLPAAVAYRSDEKHFNRLPVIIEAEKARRDHPSIVNDEHVAPAKMTRDVGDRSMLDVTGRAIQDEQTRGVPLWSGFLCDELWGQVVLELG